MFDIQKHIGLQLSEFMASSQAAINSPSQQPPTNFPPNNSTQNIPASAPPQAIPQTFGLPQASAQIIHSETQPENVFQTLLTNEFLSAMQCPVSLRSNPRSPNSTPSPGSAASHSPTTPQERVKIGAPSIHPNSSSISTPEGGVPVAVFPGPSSQLSLNSFPVQPDYKNSLPQLRTVKKECETVRGKQMAQQVEQLEAMILAMRGQYQQEIEKYKTQLCLQVDSYSRLQSRAKQIKEEYKTNKKVVAEQEKLKKDYDRLVKQMEEERKARMEEKNAKSIESKKLINAIRNELEHQKQTNIDSKSLIIARTRENEELVERLARVEQELTKRDANVMNLKRDVIDVTEKYKLVQQQLVQKKFNSANLKLKIAYANCEAQIRERSKLSNPERYNLSQWKQCQDDIRRKIEENQRQYNQYVISLHENTDPETVRFEEEPRGPPVEISVPPLPLQRYDDILLGRVAPALLFNQPTGPSVSDELQTARINSELENIASTLDGVEGNAVQPTSSLLPPAVETTFPLVQSQQIAPEALQLPTLETSPPVPLVPTLNPTNVTISTAMPIDPTFELVTDQLNAFNISNPRTESLNSSSSSYIAMVGRGRGRQINSPSGPGVRVRSRGRGRGKSRKMPNHSFSSSDVSSDIPTNAGNGNLRTVSRQPSNEKPGSALRAPRNDQEPSSAIPLLFEPIHSANASQSSDSQPGPSQSSNPTSSEETLLPEEADDLKARLREMYPILSEKDADGYLDKLSKQKIYRLRTKHCNKFQRLLNIVKADIEAKTNFPEDSSQRKDVSHDNTCVICLENLSIGEVHVTQCAHRFHKTCIDNWFGTGNRTCPTCRTPIVTGQEGRAWAIAAGQLPPDQRTPEQLQWLEGIYRLTEEEFLELDDETTSEYYRLADYNDENYGPSEEDVRQWYDQYPSGFDNRGRTLEDYYHYFDWDLYHD